MYTIGVDLGGTKICTGVMDETGTLLTTIEIPTNASDGRDAVLERIAGTIQDAIADVPRLEELKGIGIGAPGPLNPHAGTVLNPPNLPGWNNVPLRQFIAERFGQTVHLTNDANAAALAEHQFGAGRGTRNMVYVTVSTGIGSGAIVDGQVRQGATGSFAELGHIIVNPDGPDCPCGNRGCLEAVASGTAIQRIGREAFGRDISVKEIAQLARQGDERAAEILQQAFDALGVGLVNVVNLFDPEVIVIGGGVAQIGDPMFQHLRTKVAANRFHPFAANVQVVPAALGTKAGVIGAAALPLVM